MPPPTFSERIRLRRARWYGRARGPLELVHRMRERRTYREAAEPDDAWRCCPNWPRTLVNKWNGRALAQKHGCPLPVLYWRGRAPTEELLASLPRRYVIRKVWGAVRRDVHAMVDGRDVLQHETLGPAALAAQLAGSPVPFLIEEFVGRAGDETALPVEYKVHTFGARVVLVGVYERAGRRAHACSYYTPAWGPMPDRMNFEIPPAAAPAPAPRFLEAMLAGAARLGAEIGTYMRVDFFAHGDRFVFNEFSTTPQLFYTPYADAFLAGLWQELMPEAI